MKRKIITMVLITLFLQGCGSNKNAVYEDNTNDFLKPKIAEVEVYSDVKITDLVDMVNTNIKIIDGDKLINTTNLGNQEIKINYEYQDKLYTYKQNIMVKDTTPPLVFSGTNKTVNLNYDKDLCDVITYGDNYTQDVKCHIDGVYDLTKEGTYKLIYTLTDSSENTKVVNVTLNVQNPEPATGPTTEKKQTEFKEIYNLHKTNTTMVGIDVSKWQGEIDFSQVKAAGAEFVMIRLAHQGTSTKELNLDPYFKDNLKNAQAAGLQVGVYLYSIATTVEEALEQANFVIASLEKAKLDLPIVFDWESWSKWNSFNLSFYDINTIANTFLKQVETFGYEGMLYSSKFYLEKIWTNKENFPVWLAHYTTKTNYTGNYKLWQLCNNGHIDGIIGNVDIDILYK